MIVAGLRRAVATSLAALLLAGPLHACGRDGRTGGGSSASPGTAVPSRPPASVQPSADTGAGRIAVTPPPGRAPGTSFPITERHVTFRHGADRPLPTTIWYPDAPGPFPLVLFSHGLTSEPSAYAALLTAWARAGFVVAAPAYPHTAYGVPDLNALDIVNQPADASYVIDQVLGLAARDGDALRGRIAADRIAAAGHSAGGITTIGLFSAARDDRLRAGIVLSGEQVMSAPFTGPAAALLFVHGKLDTTVPYANGVQAFEAVPWSRAMMAVTSGGHVAITNGYRPVIATTTDFLRWSLYGDAEARGRLHHDATQDGTATLTDQL